MTAVLEAVGQLEEPLPPALLTKYRLPGRAEAVRAIHRPRSAEEAAGARRRLIFEELLTLQLGVNLMKSRGAGQTGARMGRVDLEPLWRSLPLPPPGPSAGPRARSRPTCGAPPP